MFSFNNYKFKLIFISLIYVFFDSRSYFLINNISIVKGFAHFIMLIKFYLLILLSIIIK